MQKLSKSAIDKFGEESVSSVIPIPKGNYAIKHHNDNQILAIGKELKGYIGDIIRVMYTGESKGAGDYILMSDRHGMICKFKE